MTVSDSGFVFWVLFTVTLIGSLVMLAMEDTEGAGTPIWEPDLGGIDETPLGATYNVPFAARGPNNIVYRVWQDDDYAIKVSYTDNNASSWAVSTVIDSAWKGHTSVGIGGIVVMANNTTCVHFTTVDADDTYNTYLAFRWNWAGAWDVREVYGSDSEGMSFPKMAINQTHIALLYVTGGNTIRFKTYNMATDTFSSIPSETPEMWVAAWSNAGDYDITVNQSGYFIIASESWSGSSYRYYIRDLDKVHAVIYADTAAAVSEVYCVNLMCRSDDTLVIGHTMFWNGGLRYGIQVMNQSAPWGVFTKVLLNWETGYELDVMSLGSCIDDDDFITFYWANDTGGGGATYISKMTQLGDASEEEWESAIQDAVYDYGTDDDAWYASSWYDGRYPIVGGYSVNIPASGWMGHHIYMNEVGTPDDYAFALYWSVTFNWYDWGPGGPGGPGDDDDEPDPGIEWNINPDAFIGLLWLIFITLCVCVALIDKVQEISTKRRGG